MFNREAGTGEWAELPTAKSSSRTPSRKSFIFTTEYSARPRVTGGKNYVVKVYEILQDLTITPIGEREANTAAHKGEQSEAWEIILKHNALGAARLKMIEQGEAKKTHGSVGYYHWGFKDEYNVYLQKVE